MNEEENLMLAKLEKRIIEKGVSNEFLIAILNLIVQYLGLKTIQEYKKKYKMTYRGVKNHRQIIKLFNKNFVIDNE